MKYGTQWAAMLDSVQPDELILRRTQVRADAADFTAGVRGAEVCRHRPCIGDITSRVA
jgi:hypothetical protein